MARPRLSSPDQPWPKRTLLRLYEFSASLKLAVIVILTYSFVLAMVTMLIEPKFGAGGAAWYVYDHWTFIVLNALLAWNIFSAAAIRYPWKRHQTGFVITHLGLLTLLAGSAISFRGNLNSQMLIFKGDDARYAIDVNRAFLRFTDLPGRAEPLTVNFDGGPFHWGAHPMANLLADWKFAPIRTVTRGWLNLMGVDRSRRAEHEPFPLYETETLKVDIVDYLSRAGDVGVPFVELSFSNPLFSETMEVELQNREYWAGPSKIAFGSTSFGAGTVQSRRMYLWQAETEEERDRFLKCIPNSAVTGEGTLVINYRDRVARIPLSAFSVEWPDWWRPTVVYANDFLNVELLDTGNFLEDVTTESLKRYPWVANNISLDRQQFSMGAHLKFRITPKDADAVEAVLFPQFPQFSRNLTKDLRAEFFEPSQSSNICLVAGPGPQLCYRVWQQQKSREGNQPPTGQVRVGRFEITYDPTRECFRGTNVADAFMMGARGAWRMSLRTFLPPSDEVMEYVSQVQLHAARNPDTAAMEKMFLKVSRKSLPLQMPFDKEAGQILKRVLVRFQQRAGGDGEWETTRKVWVPLSIPPKWARAHGVRGIPETTTVSLPGVSKPITLSFDAHKTDVGFRVRLVDFDLLRDPGARTPRDYRAKVAVVDVRRDEKFQQALADYRNQDDPIAKEQARLKLAALRHDLEMATLKKLKRKDFDEARHLAGRDDQIAAKEIYMNQPLDYSGTKGRTLRFFQENWGPARKVEDDEIPMFTVLRVNHDPGRWVKYLGSGLLCIGIFLMFYMKAYFRRPGGKARGGETSAATADEAATEPET